MNAEVVLYEGSGPSGSAFMVRSSTVNGPLVNGKAIMLTILACLEQIETLTDNKRRTAPALRFILGKYDGSLGTSGSVAWMFDRKGYLEVRSSGLRSSLCRSIKTHTCALDRAQVQGLG